MTEPEWVPSDFDFGSREAWSVQDSAYGEAEDMGEALKLLFSPDAESHVRAERQMYHHLTHQGGRFGATIFALPILLSALDHPDCQARALILRFLVDAGFGVPDYHLPFGIAPARHRERLIHQATATSITREEMIEPLCSAQIALEIFDFVRAERSRLKPSLQAPAADERIAATWAAAFWLPDDAETRAVLSDVAEHGAGPERWAATLSLATIERAMGTEPCTASVETALGAADEREAFVAAFAAAEPETIDSLAAPLMRGVANFEAYPEDFGGDAAAESCWRATWGDLRQKTRRLVVAMLKAPSDAWVDALPSADEIRTVVGALDVVSELLAIVSPGGDGRFPPLPVAALTPIQRRALEAIRDHGAWQLSGDTPYLNMHEVMSYAGLPTTREALGAYLAGEAL